MQLGIPAFGLAVAAMAAFAAAGILYSRSRRVSLEGFISARHTVGGATATATVVASILGAWILFSPAEAATWAGLAALIGYGVGQALPILAFIVLGPRMRRLMPEGHSLTEFVRHRFGPAVYAFVLLIMVLYMFTFLAAEMGAIARAIELITGAPLLLTLVLVGAATLLYTTYGGLRAAIFTDTLQFALIIPLLLVVFIAVMSQLGGWTASFDAVREVNPDLLSMSHRPGVEFGFTLVIAVLAANLFHQGFWQRVYAAKTERDLRRGFLAAGVIVTPMIIIGGVFGLWAVGAGAAETPAVSLFSLVLDTLPAWAILTVMVLALVLVMSSMDTLLNGIASIFTTDLPRVAPAFSGAQLLAWSRGITAALIVPALIVGLLFDSVLYLFLIADLVCAGAMVPIFLGLFVRRFGGGAALTSALCGIAAGALFFPTKSLSGWWTWDGLTGVWHVLASGSTLASFLIAVAVSMAVAGVFLALGARRPEAEGYDFGELAARVKLMED
ncbi:MAG: hypothetical protein J4F32_00660 [Dehalococcoidia bacterium]|nr:hypothetical protein [Dehalococcoidia bacterium]